MGTGAPEVCKAIALWKRIAIQAAIGGAAFGAVVVIGTAIAAYVANRPKEWDDRSLKVVHSEGHPFSKMNGEMKEESSGIDFEVDIQNTTGTDITITQDLSVMSQTRSTHALKDTFLKLPRAYFIPARHTVSVSMGSTEICAANYDPRKCYDSYFQDEDALVIFDQGSRLKINIPMPQLIYEPGKSWFTTH